MSSKALFNILDLAGALNLLIDHRIYPLKMPQNNIYPAITYQLIGNTAISLLASDTDIETPRYQISCWGDDFTSAKDVALQVKTALIRVSGTYSGIIVMDITFDNENDIHDPETDKYQTAIDITMWHRA